MENNGEGVVFRFDADVSQRRMKMRSVTPVSSSMFDGKRVFDTKNVSGENVEENDQVRTPLRARCVNTFGNAMMKNGGHGSSSSSSAAKATNVFFSPFKMVQNPLLQAEGMDTPSPMVSASAKKKKNKQSSQRKKQRGSTPRSARRTRGRDVDALRSILGDVQKHGSNGISSLAHTETYTCENAASIEEPAVPLVCSAELRLGEENSASSSSHLTHVALGDVECGRSTRAPLRVVNTSTEPQTLKQSTPSASGQSNGALALSPSTLSIGPKQEATVYVVWTPSLAGSVRATLEVACEIGGRATTTKRVIAHGRALTRARTPPKNKTRNGSVAPEQPEQKTPVVTPNAHVPSSAMKRKARAKAASAVNVGKSPARLRQREMKLGLRKKSIAKTPNKRSRGAASASFFCSSSYLSGTRWMEKQERAYTTWINHVLMTDGVMRARLHYTIGDEESMMRQSASLRMRTRMWKLYSSQGDFVQKLLKIEKSVDSGKLSLERGGAIIKDVRIRAKTVDILLTYSEPWLRMGIETVLGLQSSVDDDLATLVADRFLGSSTGLKTDTQCTTVSKLVLKRFLVLVALLDEAASTLKLDCMPPLFAATSSGAMATHGNSAGPRSSADIVKHFLREFVKGEGDVMRHLRFLGYKLKYQQSPVDEYDFRVTNLAVDLRDGLRLGKITELLVPGADVVSKMTLPAAVRSLKIANTELALDSLRNAKDHFGTLSNTRATDLVDGNRERTLGLLWAMMIQFQIPTVVDERELDTELARLNTERHHTSQSTSASPMSTAVCADNVGENGAGDMMMVMMSPPTPPYEPGAIPAAVQAHGGLALKLFQWASSIVMRYDVQIHDFTSSFADGRALCYLVSFYLPQMLPSTDVFCGRDESELAARRRLTGCTPCAELLALRADNADGEKNSTNDIEFKDGVRRNFSILAEKSAQLGGVPHLLPSVDSHPDERCVISFLSFLCSRLLDLSKEQRAACRIQAVWREKRGIKDACGATRTPSMSSSLSVEKQTNAAIRIQAAVRGWRVRTSHRKRVAAATKLQAVVRSFLVRQRRRHEMHAAATLVQKMFRGYMARVRLHRELIAPQLLARAEDRVLILREMRWTATIIGPLVRIQASVRGWQARQSYQAMRQAAITIQSFMRMRAAMTRYVAMQSAAVRVQSAFRRHVAMCTLQTTIGAAVHIQSCYRMYRDRARYLRLRNTAVAVQASIRRNRCRRSFNATKRAAIVLQSAYRRRCAMSELQELRQAATSALQVRAASTIQAHVRARLQKREYQRMRRASIAIQARVRGRSARNAYLQKRRSAITIQRHFRRRQAARAMLRDDAQRTRAAVTIQAAMRGMKRRREFLRIRRATLLLQSATRVFLKRRHALQLVNDRNAAALRIQMAYRAARARRVQCARRENAAAVRIQSCVRGQMQRRRFLRMRNAAILIQAHVRCHKCRTQYAQAQEAALMIQTAFRQSLAVRQLQQLREDEKSRLHATREEAAVKIQSFFRRVLAIQLARRLREARRQQQEHDAAVHIQAFFRGRTCRVVLQTRRVACIRIQSSFRRHMAKQLAMRMREARLREEHAAASRIQCFYRRWSATRAEQLLRESNATRIQSVWRGYLVRRASSKKMCDIRTRFVEAALRGKLHPELRLGNRAQAAITTLMESKRLTEALQGCSILEQSTSYSHVICELLVSSTAVPKLFRFIRSCNRSKPHMELVNTILGILNNIARYHWLTSSIADVPGAVLTLVEQLQTFRDKREPYVLCIGILRSVFSDGHRRESIEDKDEVKRRIGLIVEYHKRRAAMERKCIAYAKPGSSIASLVEAKRKLSDSVAQGEALAALAALLNNNNNNESDSNDAGKGVISSAHAVHERKERASVVRKIPTSPPPPRKQ